MEEKRLPTDMRALETRIPPPIVMAVLACAAWAAVRSCPALAWAHPAATSIAAALGISGLALNLYPKCLFGRARTTVNPLRPASSTALVTTGVYRYTRNPMYLGQCVLLLGWATYLQNVAGLVVIPLFVLFITRFQIVPEERQLSTRFPDTHAALCRQARRWL